MSDIKPTFFQPIQDPNAAGIGKKIGSAADRYLSWQGRLLTWQGSARGWQVAKKSTHSRAEKAMKIATALFTLGLLPLIALIAKEIYRHSLLSRVKKECLSVSVRKCLNPHEHLYPSILLRSIEPVAPPKAIDPEQEEAEKIKRAMQLLNEALISKLSNALENRQKAIDLYLQAVLIDPKIGSQRIDFLKKRAESPHGTQAMLHLGLMYEGGFGVEQSKNQALQWYLKAKRCGDQEADKSLQRIGMQICNNSDLTFEVTVASSEIACTKTLKPQERITAEELFDSKGMSTPLYFQLLVKQGGNEIEKREFIERNTYVGLLNSSGKARAAISFKTDTSVEIAQPTTEMILEVATKLEDFLKNHVAQQPFADEWPTWDHEKQFSLFYCYHDKYCNAAHMRKEQMENAFKGACGLQQLLHWAENTSDDDSDSD